jgi:hypothetical protein
MIHNFVHARVAGRVAPLPAPKTPAAAAEPKVSFHSELSRQTSDPQPAEPAAPAASPLAAPSVPSLHSVAALPNGGLMLNPTGLNALSGGAIAYNPNYYATQDAAAQLAAQLGGSVVDLRGQISNNQAEYFIDLPNGTRINAGNLLAVLNNSFFQENSRVMDGEVAKLLNNNAVGSTNPGQGLYTVVNGQVTYDPSVNT